MKSLANEFFQTMEQGARRHQAAHPESYELIAAGIKDEQDVARQIAIVDQMIARRVQAIVLAPADSKALVGVAKKAVDAGIVVVNIDNRLDRDALADRKLSVPFVGPDNRKGAAAVGAYVAARLKPGDPVAILEGAPNAFNGIERTRGFEDAARGGGPDDRAIADGPVGNRACQPGRLGARRRTARRESHPLRQRQHGAWRGGRAEGSRTRGHRCWSPDSTTSRRCRAW